MGEQLEALLITLHLNTILLLLLWVIDFAEVQFSSVLLLGVFAKLWKVTMSHSCLFVCPQGTTGFPLDRFFMKLILDIFQKSVKEFQVLLKSDKNNGYFT
jgi:hypothetical protein